ncbi:MAG: Type 1 glutamine amidotransferase-like domain-containing protein [Promethearchaeota archaeon]
MTQMKLLLTSAGITNEHIRKALVDLLAKPINQSTALIVPTAIYAYPNASNYAWRSLQSLGNLGWKEFGVLELTALPSLKKEVWLPEVEEADAIIVGGGNVFYLSFWMQRSGLFDILPELLEKGKTYVGISAGSMILTHSLNFDRKRFEKTGIYYDDEYEEEAPINAGSDKTMRLVDFVIRPHLNSDMVPKVTLENIEKWAAKIDFPLYAIDDQTALKVIDGKVEVITEGNWKLFEKRG